MVKKGEGIFSKFRGELAKRGELKNSGGVWTLDEAMLQMHLLCYEGGPHFAHPYPIPMPILE